MHMNLASNLGYFKSSDLDSKDKLHSDELIWVLGLHLKKNRKYQNASDGVKASVSNTFCHSLVRVHIINSSYLYYLLSIYISISFTVVHEPKQQKQKANKNTQQKPLQNTDPSCTQKICFLFSQRLQKSIRLGLK